MRARAGLVAVVALALRCASPSPITVDAGPPDSGAPETSTTDASDSGGASCTDGVKNGAETDVDCGGPTCPKCVDGRACVVEADCASQRCSAGTCGVRAWSVESLGNNLTIPPTQTWISGNASSLYLVPNLYAQSIVFMRWTGTLRFGGGGNGVCHVGQQFVVDDVPLGDASWGSAIMVQNGATRWHETFTTEVAVPLGPGLHTIGVQMDNPVGYATCYLDGDSGAAYDRSRLAVAAYDPKNAWVVESTGETGNLTSSGFVDIPGAGLSMTLSDARHVQISMAGTQLVQGTGSGYCAYRFVIDNTPLGEPTYGQTLVVGDAATGWWAPVALKWGQDMTAGAHTIKAQMANSSSTASCNAGQGNNAYARFRMFVTQSPVGGSSSSAESTGGPTILGSTSAWTPVGLSAAFSVTAPTQVQLEMAATQRTATGTSGHCSWHYVVDGVPLGDPNYGQLINVGSTATTWWTTTSLLWGQSFDAGAHTVSVEVRNSSNSGDCGTNGDALPYGRARLFVRVP
jgi:hypothetical protein